MAGLPGRALRLLIVIVCVGWLSVASAGATDLPAQFALTGGGHAIPPSFFGISMEENQLSPYEAEGRLFGRVLSLLRPRDGSPLVLRIGGKSADHTLWEPRQLARSAPYAPRTPRDLTVIGRAWMTRLATIVRADRLTLMLDLNLAVHLPRMEVDFAKAAEAALPPSSLIGLEIGNEPDLYDNQPQLAQESAFAHGDISGKWELDYSPADYRRDYSSYARSLHAALPIVPLGGPETISAPPPWIDAIEGLGSLTPQVITVHRYPESSCFPVFSQFYPSIPHLLSDDASAGLAASVAGAVALAHAHDQTLRLTEMNSVSCGGNAGVADSFASTLWSVDALLEMVQAGVDGVNWHIRPAALNAPFQPAGSGIRVLPELYGLALFTQLTGPGAQVLTGTLTQFPGLAVKVWAVRSSAGLKVLLLNKGSLAARVSLALGQHVPGSLERLLAPGIAAAQGVSFGGQSIGPDGRWHGRLRTQTIDPTPSDYDVALPAYSGALLTLPRGATARAIR